MQGLPLRSPNGFGRDGTRSASLQSRLHVLLLARSGLQPDQRAACHPTPGNQRWSGPKTNTVDVGEVTGMTVPPIVAVLLSPVVIALVLLGLRWGARKHRLMYAEISARCADIQARAAERAVVYDQAPVPCPSVDGYATAGAGTPDPAPAVAPRRVHIEMGGPGRHREAA